MKLLVMPYGAAGWERKKRLLEDIIASRSGPPFIYNDLLILLPSTRMRRTYAKLLLDIVHRVHGAASFVQPDLLTLHQFLRKLYAALGGPPVVDEDTRLVLLEGMVKGRLTGSAVFNQRPDMLAPSLSTALAAMIEQLAGAGVTPGVLKAGLSETDVVDRPQVMLLTDVYAGYEQALAERGLSDPAGMLSSLAGRFDPQWLSAYTTILIDGIHDAGGLETRVLRNIAAEERCTVLVDAPSSALLGCAGEFHPLRVTKDFLDGVGLLSGEDAAAPDEDTRFLSEALFSDKAFTEITEGAAGFSFSRKNISVLSAVTPRDEVTLIAGKVKKSLRKGAPPDSVLVTFPSLDEYGPLVEEIFTDYGIPYNRALGRQLSTSPVAMSLISLLRAGQEDFSGPSLLRIFNSPFLKFSEDPSIAPALDRLMRARRITGGKRKWLAALKHHAVEEGKDIVSAPLNDLFDALEPFSSREPAPLSTWMERLAKLVAWSGLGARVATIKGPLNMNLQAYRKLTDTLASLGRAGKLFPEFQYPFGEWLFLLRKTFMHSRFQVPPEDEGGVQVLGIGESAGLHWDEIYVGGLTDVKFPQRLPQNIFLPEATLETLGVRTLEKARLNAAHHFYRLLLSAPTVVLTWPENEGDRPVVPSPFLAELTPLRKAGLINKGMEKTSGIQFSLKLEESHSVPELAKALSLAGTVKGLEDLLNVNIDGMSGIRSALEFKPAETAPVVTPLRKREFRVTELDDYLNCPYDYYVKHVLRLAPLEEVTEDLSPLDRGSKVHGILRNFYLSWNGPVTRENRDEAGLLLRKLADPAFAVEADTFRNRRDKELFLTVMAGRFLDAEEAFWKQDMRPAYIEQKVEFFTLTLSDGTAVELKARIDRIDVDEDGNFIIVDYKTGKYPLPKMNLEQDIFQLPVYAFMARQALSGSGPALKKPIGLAYYDLAGKTGAGARDVVLFNTDFKKDQPASKPKASPKSAEDFETILKQSMDKARKAVEGILAGDFTSTPQDENKCRYCPNEVMCGKRDEE